jgi:myo-inositol-1(or 4)-monophosphatase
MDADIASQATENQRLLEVADAAARAAGETIHSHAHRIRDLVWETKSHADFVSEVDLAAEHRLRDVISARAPDATVLGEELSPDAIAAGVTFVCDPLDGTTNFLHDYPQYAVSIGVLRDGVPAAGVVFDVTRNVMYSATRGGGAFRDGVRLSISTIVEPARALIGTGFPFKHQHLVEPYVRQFVPVLRATAGIRRAGSAALDLADVAAGRFDAFWELMLAPWDIAAGILLIREAGGVVTDLDGNDVAIGHTGLIAGNPAIHQWLLETIRSA